MTIKEFEEAMERKVGPVRRSVLVMKDKIDQINAANEQHETEENKLLEVESLAMFIDWGTQTGNLLYTYKPNDRTYGFDGAIVTSPRFQPDVVAIVEFTGRACTSKMNDLNGRDWHRSSAKVHKAMSYASFYQIPYYMLYLWDLKRLYLSKPITRGVATLIWGGRTDRKSANDLEPEAVIPRGHFELIVDEGKLKPYFPWLNV